MVATVFGWTISVNICTQTGVFTVFCLEGGKMAGECQWGVYVCMVTWLVRISMIYCWSG